MQRDLIMSFLVVLFGASGTYLLLPHEHGKHIPRNVHILGGALAGVALLLFVSLWSAPVGFLRDINLFVSTGFFYAFALGAVIAAVLTVTSRDPTHSALYFAAVVLATSGLFLQASASFLAVGTVIVYAGAIIVTFLFVIMLAQMEGRAIYDRSARMPFRATWTCFVLLLGIFWALFQVQPSKQVEPAPASAVGPAVAYDDRLPLAEAYGPWTRPENRRPVADVLARAVRPTARLDAVDAAGHVVAKPHVAGLGETLYTDHLLTVELTGALLFAALIGALAIAAPKPPTRPGDATRHIADLHASTSQSTKVPV